MSALKMNWTPPPCPCCGSHAMEHRLYTHFQSRNSSGQTNGWYCSSCGAGAYQLAPAAPQTDGECGINLRNHSTSKSAIN